MRGWSSIHEKRPCRASPLRSLGLVGVEAASAPAAIATTVTSTRGETTASAMEAAAKSTTPAATPTAHAGDVGAFRRHLDVATLQHAVVKDQGLRDQAGLSELDICVPGAKQCLISS